MHVNTASIAHKLVMNTDKYTIPVYQRSYKWSEQQCNKLWEDLKDIMDESIKDYADRAFDENLLRLNINKNHFFGIIVLSNKSGGGYFIIDGQQRITTVSLLLLALRNFIYEHKLFLADPKDAVDWGSKSVCELSSDDIDDTISDSKLSSIQANFLAASASTQDGSASKNLRFRKFFTNTCEYFGDGNSKNARLQFKESPNDKEWPKLIANLPKVDPPKATSRKSTKKATKQHLSDNYSFFYRKIDALCSALEEQGLEALGVNTQDNAQGFSKEQAQILTVAMVYHAILSLVTIIVNVDPGENPQKVFESLNSTGMSLDNADKIRSFVFMELNENLHDQYFEDWLNIIKLTKGSSLEEFFRHFLMAKTGIEPREDEVYYKFTEYFNYLATIPDGAQVARKDTLMEKLLGQILSYAQNYKILKSCSIDKGDILRLDNNSQHLQDLPISSFNVLNDVALKSASTTTNKRTKKDDSKAQDGLIVPTYDAPNRLDTFTVDGATLDPYNKLYAEINSALHSNLKDKTYDSEVNKRLKELKDGGQQDILKKLETLCAFGSVVDDSCSDDKARQDLELNLKRLKALKQETPIPMLMEILNLVKTGYASIEDFNLVLEYLQSYCLRRSVCDLKSNAYKGTFLTLVSDLKKRKDELLCSRAYLVHKLLGNGDTDSVSAPANTLEGVLEQFEGKDKCKATADDFNLWIIKYLQSFISQKTGTDRFPSDEDFEKGILNKNLYSTTKKYLASEMLKRLNLKMLEKSNEVPESGELDLKVTIEHILPQTLNDDWREMLGKECEDIKKRYKDRLGNLTITTNNSKLSNHGFEEKCNNEEEGYKHSSFPITKEIAQNNTWGEEQIKAHGERLAKLSCQIWLSTEVFKERINAPSSTSKGRRTRKQ